MSVIGQPSLFGVTAVAPGAMDLAGLLLAGGTAARWSAAKDDKKPAKPKAAAQLSVLVDHPWRASLLVLECARRGLAATCVSTVEQRISVRTAHSPLLMPLVEAWSEGDRSEGARSERARWEGAWSQGAATERAATEGAARTEGQLVRVPRGLLLDGQPLRLWVAAAGGYERPGLYRLDCGLTEEADRQRVGLALAAAGLAADPVATGRGLSYRISGKRRLARLAELVGDPPKRAPMDIWPS